jgi:RNA polymerase sigma-70 factor (ECF subfamily)
MVAGPDEHNEPNHLTSLSDESLVTLFKETEDNRIIGELYKRYAHLMMGVCYKYLKKETESQDALMHVFEKLFSYLKMYEIGHFKSWLYSVTKHHCLYILKKNKEYAYEESILVWKSPKEFVEFGDDLTLAGRLENGDETRKLMKAMEELKEEQRICVDLFYLKEKSYQEVQEITRFTYKQVKSFIQNGKRNLRLILEKNNGKPG